MEPKINFDILVSQIEYTNEALQNNARLVINRHVTAKAWLTGYYIVEYEQNGSDRAKYGDKLISELSKRLGKRNFSTTNLKIFRQFYLTYPSLLSEIGKFILSNTSIGQSLTDLLQLLENKRSEKRQSLTDLSMTITQSLIAQSDSIGQSLISQFQGVAPDKLFNRLSFTHLAAILPIKDPLQRAFYETMAIRGTWSVRELQRQIDSNYYVRSGWSQKPEALADLVFYHRILKRHVIIELKANRLDYADTAQLKMYLAYYRKNIMMPDDNPPVGILMCSEVGQEMAEYTLLDTNEDVFISKYELNIPSKERMTEFLRKENEGLN